MFVGATQSGKAVSIRSASTSASRGRTAIVIWMASPVIGALNDAAERTVPSNTSASRPPPGALVVLANCAAPSSSSFTARAGLVSTESRAILTMCRPEIAIFRRTVSGRPCRSWRMSAPG